MIIKFLDKLDKNDWHVSFVQEKIHNASQDH